jgi:hypothetical protein
MVFLNFPYRVTPKNTKKKFFDFFLAGGWVGLGFSKCMGGPSIVFGGPSGAVVGGM